MEAVGFLQGAICRAYGLSLVVLFIDMHPAFDCLAPRHVAEQLRARGAMAAQVAAALCEVVAAAEGGRRPRPVADARKGDPPRWRSESCTLEQRYCAALAR